MSETTTQRFEFIGHALRGDGPFRPSVSHGSDGRAVSAGTSYLVQYPRESPEKYARRCELAFYASPLAQACARFVGYITTRAATRELPHPLYAAMADDVDGKGSSVDVFAAHFMVQAKARGSLLLLVDMPPAAALGSNAAEQLRTRAAPYWTVVLPELLTDYEVGQDGKFSHAAFRGFFGATGKDRVPCIWRFDAATWSATSDDADETVLAEGEHPLRECPLLIFTEGDDFPMFGPFASIADLSKRLFNLDSELDEILRAQTFSLLTMQVPDDSTNEQKLSAARITGETIGTNNLMVHSGSTPAFIAPPDGPARIYLDRIDKMRDQIHEIGLNVASVNQQESGIAMQMRFAAINAELAKFSAGMEDLERRAWDLSRRWLGMQAAPQIQWPRDFNIADVESELKILQDMQSTAMPAEVIAEQQKRIVAVQFAGLDQEAKDRITASIDERTLAVT